MSSYVQTFSEKDQAILDHTAFQATGCPLIRVKVEDPIHALWVNSGIMSWSFPDPNEDLPRIRYRDILEFRDIWIQARFPTVNSAAPLRGRFMPDKWVQSGGGCKAMVLAYRTFKVSVSSETPHGSVELSTVDVDQILTTCLERFHGDEMPTCTGEWTSGTESVHWHIEPLPKPDVMKIISNSTTWIEGATEKELLKQCHIVIALRRFYRHEHIGLPWAVLRDNMAYNRMLDDIFTQLEVHPSLARSLPYNEILVGEYAEYDGQQLVDMYVASHDRLVELDCAYFQMPELSEMLQEYSSGSIATLPGIRRREEGVFFSLT